MSSDWYLIQSPKYVSGFETEDFNVSASDSFDELTATFLGRSATLYGSKISGGTTKKVVFQNLTSDSEDTSNRRQILLSVGDSAGIQYIKDNTTNEYWIVNSLPSSNGMYDKVVARYCNYMLKFVSPKTGEVVTYPIFDNGSSGIGEKSTSMITVGNSQHILYIPYNDETIMLDHGFRILLDRSTTDPTAYEITQVNPTTFWYGQIGLIELVVVETQSSSLDDAYLLIPDYYSADDVYELTVTNVGDDLVLAKDATFTISATATLNGEALDQTSILFQTSDSSVATVSTAGVVTGVSNGSCVIAVKAGNARKEIKLSVEEASQTAEIKIFADSDEILYGYSKIVEFKAYINGSETPTTFSLNLSGSVASITESGITAAGTDYAKITAFDNIDNVGEKFTLTISSDDLRVSASKTLSVGGWF